jgi:ADP-ribose pyrophosphatase YjhB (NUDIX family)
MPSIRPIAICIVHKADTILVFEGRDHVKQQTFYRPLGGAIEFGETGRQAITREIKEELGADLEDLRYLFTLENIFTCDGQAGHEIVLVFTARLTEPGFYQQAQFTIYEDSGETFQAFWKPLSDFGPDGVPLYPDGLLERLLS